MEEQKQDRRIRKTQKQLKNSLIQLMKEKEFKNISVKDITELADLNRGTFYLHYRDTYDLLEKTEAEVLADFKSMIDGYVNSFSVMTLKPVMRPVVDYIEENAEICKVLFENKASNDFVGQLHGLIRENGQMIIKREYPDADRTASDSFLEFATYGLIGMLKQWIDLGMRLSKEQLVEIADRAVVGAAKELLELKD